MDGSAFHLRFQCSLPSRKDECVNAVRTEFLATSTTRGRFVSDQCHCLSLRLAKLLTLIPRIQIVGQAIRLHVHPVRVLSLLGT